MISGRAVAAWALALCCTRGVPAQSLMDRVSAGSSLWSSAGPGTGRGLVIEGVPGERTRIRMHPRWPHTAEAWQMVLMQAGQPTWTWIGGPGQTLRTDDVTFGDDGALGVIVRTLGVGSGEFVLSTSSRLPAGSMHPAVASTPDPSGGSGPAVLFDLSSWLRPGLELHVKARFRSPDGVVSGADPACAPGYVVTPPLLAGAPFFESFPVPSLPWPKSQADVLYALGLEHVAFAAASACGVQHVSARVRSRHFTIDKPVHPDKPSSWDPAGLGNWPVQADAIEVWPGSHVKVSGTIHAPKCTEPTPSRTLRVWLASPHVSSLAPPTGVDLTGPIQLEFTQVFMPFEVDVSVPPGLAPGLYALQLEIGTPGDVDPCGDSPLYPPYPLLLRVLEP